MPDIERPQRTNISRVPEARRRFPIAVVGRERHQDVEF
jgi:hypothetical protein